MTRLLYIPDSRFMFFFMKDVKTGKYGITIEIENSIYKTKEHVGFILEDRHTTINLQNDKEFRRINGFNQRWDLYPLSPEEFEFVP